MSHSSILFGTLGEGSIYLDVLPRKLPTLLEEESLRQDSGQLRGLADWFKETEKASQRSTRGHGHQGALSK